MTVKPWTSANAWLRTENRILNADYIVITLYQFPLAILQLRKQYDNTQLQFKQNCIAVNG